MSVSAAAADSEPANKRARTSASATSTAACLDILDEGEVLYQACTANTEIAKKMFKDLQAFVPELRVRFLPSREIEIFNHDEATQDMVFCSMRHFEKFACVDPDRVFEFSVRAKTVADILAKMPMSMVVMFYLTDSCLDVDGSVIRLGLRGLCTETGKTIDHRITTNAMLDDDSVTATAASAAASAIYSSSSSSSSSGGVATASAGFRNWLRDGDKQYRCEITWNTRDLNESLENLANLKEARWVSITATAGDVCEIETDTKTTSSRVRQTQASRKYSFVRFGAEPVVTNKFRLRSLQDFMKCKDLCADVSLLLDAELPLVLKFAVPSFGTLCAYTPIFQKNEE